MILQRNVIVGVIILIRHAQKIRKTIGGICSIVTVFLIDHNLIGVCCQMEICCIYVGKIDIIR